MKKFTLFILVSLWLLSSSASADIVGLWHFDEGFGIDAFDSSEYENHFGLFNEPNGMVDGLPSESTMPRWIDHFGYGTALEFCTMPDGSFPDYLNQNWNYAYLVEAKTSSLSNLGTKWTIAMWINQYVNDPGINIGGGGGYQRVISCPAYEIELGTPYDPIDYFWPQYPEGVAGPLDVPIGNTYPLNEWYHLALVYDGFTLVKYINGEPNEAVWIENESLPDTWNSWEYLRLARQTDQQKDYFIGALDDVAIFNEALSQEQIETIMSGDFSGPWMETDSENDLPITYLWDPSFIIRYKNGQVILDYDEKAPGKESWNWDKEGILDDPNYYGLVNAGLWDGDATTIEYAAYCSIGDYISQVALGRFAFQDITYEFKARVGGENAMGNIVGVRFYRVNPYDYNDVTLITDLNTEIMQDGEWHELSTLYTSNGADHQQRFKAVCYIDKGFGPGRGDTFGYFDYVRIDPYEFLTCQAKIDYNFGNSGVPRDLNNDCIVDFRDYCLIANDWYNIYPPEPSINVGEMLENSDFYEDLHNVPNHGDFVAVTPMGWEFVPETFDPYVAGIQNRDRDGYVANQANQPAGGSVSAYIDPNTILQQTVVSSPIQNGQQYYVTAMVSGSGGAYLSMVTMTLEYVDDPYNPTTVVAVATDTYILPEVLVWRQLAAEYISEMSSEGKYLRIKFDLGPNPFSSSAATGYANIGKASITTIRPDTWPRYNLIANGDFEDYSTLPMGTNNNDGYLDLFSYPNHYTIGSIPDWKTTGALYGLNCMFWAPPPQPAMGRVSAWFDGTIEQHVETETILGNQTYYIDYIACLNAYDYSWGGIPWPISDPHIIVDVFWVAPDQNDLSGIIDEDWGFITSVQSPIAGPLFGDPDYYDSPYTPWLLVEDSFTADLSLHGMNFYVMAYCDDFTTIYTTFEEIYLSTEPRVQIEPYTCWEQSYSGAVKSDIDGNCCVDLSDIALFLDNWLACEDPLLCN